MRIQHNIMAMSAYRNYTNNVNAMKKNLEKLSSGYKINRAGDDAAGLAISEKMRAQITGLTQAQNNAKSGINLVQTAEGALQEVHDMLNRMVKLADQSANGTYDNTTDRAQLQKEVDQLLSEINRIADSANFNGIKLLNGDMDAGGDSVVTEGAFKALKSTGTLAAGKLPPKGSVLGTNTVVHQNPAAGSDTTAFSIDLHNLTLADGGKIQIDIGGKKVALAAAATKDMDAEDIAAAFAAGNADVTVDGVAGDTDNVITIDGTKYDVSADGTRLTFTQAADDDTTPTIPKEITISDPEADTNAAAVYEQTGLTVSGDDAIGATYVEGVTDGDTSDGDDSTEATLTIDLTGLDVDKAGTLKISIAGNDYEVEVTEAEVAAKDTTGIDEVVANKLQALLTDIEDEDAGKFSVDGFTKGDKTITLKAENTGPAKAALAETIAVAEKAAVEDPGNAVSGDYNKSTTVIETKSAATGERIASTKFTLTEEMVGDGSTITIGDTTYTFTTDADKIGEDGYVDATGGDVSKIAERLTKAAEDNATWTVGHDGTSITVTEVVGQTKFDLTTVEGIEKSLATRASSPLRRTTPRA